MANWAFHNSGIHTRLFLASCVRCATVTPIHDRNWPISRVSSIIVGAFRSNINQFVKYDYKSKSRISKWLLITTCLIDLYFVKCDTTILCDHTFQYLNHIFWVSLILVARPSNIQRAGSVNTVIVSTCSFSNNKNTIMELKKYMAHVFYAFCVCVCVLPWIYVIYSTDGFHNALKKREKRQEWKMVLFWSGIISFGFSLLVLIDHKFASRSKSSFFREIINIKFIAAFFSLSLFQHPCWYLCTNNMRAQHQILVMVSIKIWIYATNANRTAIHTSVGIPTTIFFPLYYYCLGKAVFYD